MEDLLVTYDMTVRNNKGKIVQYSYGDDGIDPVKVENQFFNLVNMSLEDIYNHFTIPRDVKKVNSSPYMSSVISRIKKQETEFNEIIKKETII